MENKRTCHTCFYYDKKNYKVCNECDHNKGDRIFNNWQPLPTPTEMIEMFIKQEQWDDANKVKNNIGYVVSVAPDQPTLQDYIAKVIKEKGYIKQEDAINEVEIDEGKFCGITDKINAQFNDIYGSLSLLKMTSKEMFVNMDKVILGVVYNLNPIKPKKPINK